MDLTSSLMEALSGTAKFKRIEQLKRWEESETNKESSVLKERTKKINFSDGCVFLAACAAGDKDEVERLVAKGADINTANVDGLTALHQSCIDDNLEMVEFLVESGADINCGDNEGWTPLHATASCGFISIARYLIEHGANVAAVNNDGELPIDIAESDDMEELLQQEINKQEIDCESARNEEERLMLEDANQWLNMGSFLDRPHPKTGATALHVASAKGYIKVMSALLQSGANVNTQDVDGWTGLHAAAHWGQKEACEMLVEHSADMDIKNLVGQTPYDVADPEIVKLLEDLKKKQVSLAKDKTQNIMDIESTVINRRMMAGCDKTSLPHALTGQEGVATEARQIKSVIKRETNEETSSESSESKEEENNESANEKNIVEKRNKVNKTEEAKDNLRKQTVPSKSDDHIRIREPPKMPREVTENEDDIPAWRRGVRKVDSAPPNSEIIPRNAVGQRSSVPININFDQGSQEEVKERHRPSSIESGDRYSKFGSFVRPSRFKRPNSLPASMTANPPNITVTAAPSGRLSSLIESISTQSFYRKRDDSAQVSRPSSADLSSQNRLASDQAPTSDAASDTSAPSTPGTVSGAQLRRSFVPPVRDEESETQRKAHAKRVRETRRSTQGVTLEVVKSAEQLIKQQQPKEQLETKVDRQPLTTATERRRIQNKDDNNLPGEAIERRSSWRLRLEQDQNKAPDDTYRSFRRSQDLTPTDDTSSANAQLRRARVPTSDTEANNNLAPKATANVRTRLSRSDDNVTDKENGPVSATNAQTTQAVIQRRRRPKRRSTGVVYPDADEKEGMEPKDEEKKETKVEEENSGQAVPERSYRSRFGSAGSLADGSTRSDTPGSRYSERLSRTSSASSTAGLANDSEEKDYKKLYDEVKQDNERLREKLRKTEIELDDNKQQLDKIQNIQRNSSSDAEKRERRALERKVSEMEEELKQLEQLRIDNQRLRDENGALIRVISKLSK